MSIALLLYIVCVFFIIPVNLKHLKWFYLFFLRCSHFLSWLFYCASVKLVSYLPHLLTKNIATFFPWTFFFFSFGKKWYSVCRHVCICVKQFPNPRNVVLIKHLFFFFVKYCQSAKLFYLVQTWAKLLAASVWDEAWLLLSAIGVCFPFSLCGWMLCSWGLTFIGLGRTQNINI